MKAIEGNYNQLLEEEKKLIGEVHKENEKIFELQKRHADFVESIQNNISETVQKQFVKNSSEVHRISKVL